LQLNADALTQVFGPTGTLMQMDRRLQEVEATMIRSTKVQAEMVRQVGQIGEWLRSDT
jgi:hypothetical protein